MGMSAYAYLVYGMYLGDEEDYNINGVLPTDWIPTEKEFNADDFDWYGWNPGETFDGILRDEWGDICKKEGRLYENDDYYEGYYEWIEQYPVEMVYAGCDEYRRYILAVNGTKKYTEWEPETILESDLVVPDKKIKAAREWAFEKGFKKIDFEWILIPSYD